MSQVMLNRITVILPDSWFGDTSSTLVSADKSMILTDYILIGVVIGLIGVLESRQTIYALLWLVFSFICSAIFFITMEMNLLGLLFIIVYIGAIAMLFLYMIMLIDPEHNIPSNLFYEFGAVLFIIVGFALIPQNYDIWLSAFSGDEIWLEQSFLTSDISVMAVSLYNHYGWPVILVGFLLFEAMLVAINIARFPTHN